MIPFFITHVAAGAAEQVGGWPMRSVRHSTPFFSSPAANVGPL